MFFDLSDIDETATLEKRVDLYTKLLERGWSREECEAVTGLIYIKPLRGRVCCYVEDVPTQGGI
jgi:hypothetical protein